MPKIKKILKTIVDILTLFVFLILIIIIFSKVKMMFSGKNYFDFFGYSIFSVATGSMEPTLKQNDIILIKKEKDYNVDDIVTYENEGNYITHRIVTKRGKDLVTKGDANNTKDVPITIDDVIGKMVKVYPNAGIWQKVFTTPQIIIMVFVTLILFDFAFSYKGFKNKKNAELVEKIKHINLKEVNKKIKIASKMTSKIKKEETKEIVEEAPKMSNSEIIELCKKTEMIQNGEPVDLEKKEKEFLNYTIRLDLNELQKQIGDNIRKEKDE